MSLNFIKIDQENKNLIEEFLKTAGKSLDTFRYFKTRDISVVEKHRVTVVAQKNNVTIGYGHLDEDSGKVWLGIAVAYDQIGKGYGAEILDASSNGEQ